jgi:hypothetical protein
MAGWHVEIRDENDVLLTQADVEADLVECVRSADFVGILADGQTAATGYLTIAQAKQERFKGYRTPLEGGATEEVKVSR